MKTSRFIPILSALAAALPFAINSPAFAQEMTDGMGMPSDKPEHCLSLNRIRNTEVLGDSHILFKMVDGKNYVNVLSHPCPGLRKDKTIMFRASIGQLCDLDVVTVLDNLGFGFMPGASCGLGQFRPIDEEGLEDLKTSMKQEGR